MLDMSSSVMSHKISFYKCYLIIDLFVIFIWAVLAFVIMLLFISCIVRTVAAFCSVLHSCPGPLMAFYCLGAKRDYSGNIKEKARSKCSVLKNKDQHNHRLEKFPSVVLLIFLHFFFSFFKLQCVMTHEKFC